MAAIRVWVSDSAGSRFAALRRPHLQPYHCGDQRQTVAHAVIDLDQQNMGTVARAGQINRPLVHPLLQIGIKLGNLIAGAPHIERAVHNYRQSRRYN